MAWFKHKSEAKPELPANHYDFATIVKSARESDPGRFKKLQHLFKQQPRVKKQSEHK